MNARLTTEQGAKVLYVLWSDRILNILRGKRRGHGRTARTS